MTEASSQPHPSSNKGADPLFPYFFSTITVRLPGVSAGCPEFAATLPATS